MYLCSTVFQLIFGQNSPFFLKTSANSLDPDWIPIRLLVLTFCYTVFQPSSENWHTKTYVILQQIGWITVSVLPFCPKGFGRQLMYSFYSVIAGKQSLLQVSWNSIHRYFCLLNWNCDEDFYVFITICASSVSWDFWIFSVFVVYCICIIFLHYYLVLCKLNKICSNIWLQFAAVFVLAPVNSYYDEYSIVIPTLTNIYNLNH